MLILLTNDDGVQAEGLTALYEVLAERHDVLVVAPDRERSGSSHAITVFQPLMVHRTHIGRPDSSSRATEAWAVHGTPADCVKLAVASLLPQKPDLVVSGINRGPNLGTDVFYSGTVSAAIEAVILGFPAVAVSLAAFSDLDYSFAAEVTAYLGEMVRRRGLPANTLLNVNVPATAREAVAGIRVTRLSGHKWHDTFEERADPRGHSYFWLVGEPLTTEAEPGTDLEAIRDNCVSVTPVHLDLTHHSIMEELGGWNLSLDELTTSDT
ncbi:MAG: 5'/3'-nucleotidase SurE [Bacillota bacterium]|nr:MAG: 5'/3'-nucleotidase SurE [Bacillota bacterium]